MSSGATTQEQVETVLWPWVDRVVQAWSVPGLAVCVVHGGNRVLVRGFGSRDRTTGEPVTADTLFHLASVSKTFVATAVMQLVEAGAIDLETSITAYLPDLPWADARAGRITVAHLLSHRSGIGDVSDYGWHDPQTDDGALARFAAQVAGWPLEHEPGARFAYSNAAYEVLGHLLATVGGQPFESQLRERVLDPLGMTTSTCLPQEVPPHLRALPHLGLPPLPLDRGYPYTRQHAPSSSVHSSATELGRWMVAHLARGAGIVSTATHEDMWRPQVPSGGVWHAQMARGWFWGTSRGHRVVNHSGADPGFESNLVLAPDLGLGVAVLVDCNTAPVTELTEGALDVLVGRAPLAPPPPPVTVPLGPVLQEQGVEAAAEAYHAIAAADPPVAELGEQAFEDATWGAVEMHRTDLVRPVLELWRRVQPESSAMWSATGWAHEVDGRPDIALEHARRAVELDPGNEEAATMLRRLSTGT